MLFAYNGGVTNLKRQPGKSCEAEGEDVIWGIIWRYRSSHLDIVSTSTFLLWGTCVSIVRCYVYVGEAAAVEVAAVLHESDVSY